LFFSGYKASRKRFDKPCSEIAMPLNPAGGAGGRPCKAHLSAKQAQASKNRRIKEKS
jgi:hypothetical protein